MLEKIKFYFKRYTTPEPPAEFSSTTDRELYWLFHGFFVLLYAHVFFGLSGLAFLGVVFGPLVAWVYGGAWIYIGGAAFIGSAACWCWFLFRHP